MNTLKTAKGAAKVAIDPFEELTTQARPFFDEARQQLAPFLGKGAFNSKPKEIGKSELARAREAEKIEEMKKDEKQETQFVMSKWKEQYREFEAKSTTENNQMKREVQELQQEVASIAKTAGVDTKIHLENVPKKVGILDIKRLKSIIFLLKIKADQSKSASELVNTRKGAKRTTGMLAWVSGKQGKIYEQGTMTLQG